jgi:hypothetical protein
LTEPAVAAKFENVLQQCTTAYSLSVTLILELRVSVKLFHADKKCVKFGITVQQWDAVDAV